MKQIIFLFIGLLLLPTVSPAIGCYWGFKSGRSGPSIFTCKGEKYYFGDFICPKETYKDIFCHEKFSKSGKECYENRLNKDNVDCKEEKDKELAKINSPIRLNRKTTFQGGSK